MPVRMVGGWVRTARQEQLSRVTMRDWLALLIIRAARRLTTWGPTDDYLAEAERHQQWDAFRDR